MKGQLRSLLSVKWILTTLLVIAAVGVMIRLGIWQLDRLAQRRALNSRVQAQIAAPALDLNQAVKEMDPNQLDQLLYDSEYRTVTVTGEYDPSQEVALRNQTWENRLGVHLLTPLKIAGTGQSVLVDRGWISEDDFDSGNWTSFSEAGTVKVEGILRRSRTRPDIGRQPDPAYSPGAARLTAFYAANVERMSQQISYPVLPVYVLQSPDPAFQGPPYREKEELVFTEGSHMGYAIQWFSFAAMLAVGYPFFVRHELKQKG